MFEVGFTEIILIFGIALLVLGPQQGPTGLFLAVGTVNYAYKLSAAIALIPLIYLMRRGIERYLGTEESARLKREAAAG